MPLFCCWNHLRNTSSPSHRSGFRNHFVFDPFGSNTLMILVPFLQMVWTVWFTWPNSQHAYVFFFDFFYLTRHKKSKLFLRRLEPCFCSWLSHVVTLQVSWLVVKVEGSFTHIVDYLCCCHFPYLEYIGLPQVAEDSLFQGRYGGSKLQKEVYFLEDYIGIDDWQCRYVRGR